MSEKPNDGTVAMHIGEIEEAEYMAVEDYLPTLPNTVSVGHNIFLYGLDHATPLGVRSSYLIK